MYFLGVDGGGTKTEAAILREDGVVVGTGIGGPANLYTVDEREIKESVTHAVLRAVWHAGLERAEFGAGFFGVAGTVTRQDRERLRVTVETCVSCERLDVHHDAHVALAGATGCGSGIVLMAGTGTCAYGLHPSGREALVGGWGYGISDEGGAYDIARRAMLHAARVWDGREAPTLLSDQLLERLGASEPRQVLWEVYRARTGHVAWIASLAPVVSQAAAEGDPAACAILEQCAAALAELPVAVQHKLDCPAPWSLVLAGGALQAGEVLLGPLRRYVERRLDGFTLLHPCRGGAVGAAMLAAKLAGRNLPEPVMKGPLD